MKLHKVWSVLEEYKGRRNVPVIWYCSKRTVPKLPYSNQIKDYQSDYLFAKGSESYVDELFGETEVEELRIYLSSQGINTYVEDVEIPIEELTFPLGWMPSDSEHGFYELFKETDYRLSIPICGYYYMNTSIEDGDNFGNLNNLIKWYHQAGAYDDDDDTEFIDCIMTKMFQASFN